METRIEILSNGIWKKLLLKDKATLRYNKVVNKIGNPETREIGHTNTFSLPLTNENISALNLNVFNHKTLAKSLNSRYEARYFIEEKLIQKGFLVINNFERGEVRVNLIDNSLNIIEKWSNIKFIDLLRSETLSIPADYQTAISEMQNYFIDPNNVLPNLNTIGTRGYNLALFPNNLNTIGEKFQKDVNGNRLDDTFNPYQSRPIFNSKSIFDLACEAYGYTPIFDDSVDWNKVAKEYIVTEGLDKNSDEEDNFRSYGELFAPGFPFSNGRRVFAKFLTTTEGNEVINIIGGDPTTTLNTRVIIPNDIPNWVEPNLVWDTFVYRDLKCVFQPDLSVELNGLIKYELFVINPDNFPGLNSTPDKMYSCWTNSTPGGDVVFREMNVQSFEVDTSIEGPTPDYVLMTIIINKSEIDVKPLNADEFIGLLGSVITKDEGASIMGPNSAVKGTQNILESFSVEEVVSFDDFGQYIDTNVDLTFAAPTERVINLLKELMNKNGILMEIDDDDKTILFFNYNIYRSKIAKLNFSDWSKYLLKYEPFVYNTDYGNSYAKNNEIGLKDAFKGNTTKIKLINQGVDSKNKEYVSNFNKLFKDIESVKSVNFTNTPYVEYENKGLGLVTRIDDLGALNQINANGVSQGVLNNLPALVNVNIFDVPDGITSWYNLVDNSVKASPSFLLPLEVVRNQKISEPIYVNELHGFWIIEEISEYINEIEKVVVKLIKVNDIEQYFGEFNNDFSQDFKI